MTIVECVPNFSEGRDSCRVDEIVSALLDGPGVYLLDREMDRDHNRCVITLAGEKETIGEAALRGIGKAAELIDLNLHQGAHPRLGATDVVPFVPVSGVTLEDCVRIAEWVAEQAWLRFKVPTYLYEAAARSPERKNLEDIRRGQFEGVREEVRTRPERRPDFGEDAFHPTAGATVVGARKFLIAYNINLNTSDVGLAKSVAKKIRASSGGFRCVKAMGVDLAARGLAQVSMNLTDFETTSLGTVFDAVTRQVAAQNVTVAGSEIVGLIPRRALEDAAVHYLKVENFRPELILENRLAAVLERRRSSQSRPYSSMVGSFLEAVAAPAPTPGGGSVAALAGALGAALGEMVCNLTLGKKSLASHHERVSQARVRLADLRRRLEQNIDRDAAAYEAVIGAMKRPKATEAEQAARSKAVEVASKAAALVPLDTAELALQAAREIESLGGATLPSASSDLVVAFEMCEAARHGGVENVRANLPSIRDQAWMAEVEARLNRVLQTGGQDSLNPGSSPQEHKHTPTHG